MTNEPMHTSGDLSGTTIYIVSHFALTADALSAMLTLRTNAACTCARTFKDIFGQQADLKPPLLILWDCAGKSLGAFMDEFIGEVRQYVQEHRIALFNVRQGVKIEESCMNEGVRGVFYEDVTTGMFLKGIYAICKGELWFSRESMTKYILEERDEAVASLKVRKILTGREIEILSLLAIGCKNEDIAGKLCISPHTIKTHLYNIYRKINVSNRLQATLWAAKNL